MNVSSRFASPLRTGTRYKLTWNTITDLAWILSMSPFANCSDNRISVVMWTSSLRSLPSIYKFWRKSSGIFLWKCCSESGSKYLYRLKSIESHHPNTALSPDWIACTFVVYGGTQIINLNSNRWLFKTRFSRLTTVPSVIISWNQIPKLSQIQSLTSIYIYLHIYIFWNFQKCCSKNVHILYRN